MSNLAIVAVAVLVVNLPFGFWRAGVKRFTLQWFLSIHAPVPVVVGLRALSGLGWQLSTVPALGRCVFCRAIPRGTIPLLVGEKMQGRPTRQLAGC